MTSVVVLGIDGLDWQYVQDHLSELPAFHGLAARGTFGPLPSVFPPDSIPAWTTIFTGLGPGEHGIVESIDYLASRPAEAVEDAASFLRGRTFWDRASAAGKKVCVINAFMAYPAWPVNGVMVSGPVFVDSDRPSACPPSILLDLEPLPQLGGIVDFPTERTMSAFIEATLRTTEQQAGLGLRLLREQRPDLFFLNILTIDRLQHFAWRFCDPADPTYPGENEHATAIARAYAAADSLVARFADAAGEDALLLVISDHGHGRRPTRMVFIDELLRRAGLVSTGSRGARAQAFALEKAKRGLLSLAARLSVEGPAYAVARHVPGRKKLKTSSYAVAAESRARPSRAFGRNASGGVELSGALVAAERDRLAADVIRLLRTLRDEDGQRVVEWAEPRECVLSGPLLGRFPDVLFQLKDGYGVDFGVFGPLFAPDPMHRRISGGHKPIGIFAANRPAAALKSVPTSLEGVSALILAGLDIS